MTKQENPYESPTITEVAVPNDVQEARPELAAQITRWMAWAGILYNGMGLPIALNLELARAESISTAHFRFMVVVGFLLIGYFVALLAFSYAVKYQWPKWRGAAKLLLVSTGIMFFPVLTIPSIIAIRALGRRRATSPSSVSKTLPYGDPEL